MARQRHRGLLFEGSEHDDTRLGSGMTTSWASSRQRTIARATSGHAVGNTNPDDDAVMRIGSKLEAGGPTPTHGMQAMELAGAPPPRTVILATCRKLCRQAAKPSDLLERPPLQCAERRTTPSGTTPSLTRCHKAMSSLRARATIIFLRRRCAFSVRTRNHLASALSFWNLRKRHAN